jgi:rhodanese-related sulfurtransferase
MILSPLLSASELARLLGDAPTAEHSLLQGKPLVVDLRREEDFAEAHPRGAVCCPFDWKESTHGDADADIAADTLAAAAAHASGTGARSPEDVLSTLRARVKESDLESAPVIVIAAPRRAAAQAFAADLVRAGVPRVALLRGGVAAYASADLAPLVVRAPIPLKPDGGR